MNENEDGPIPGIIGEDIPDEPAETQPVEQTQEKVFDSNSFTSNDSEPESLVPAKAKKQQKSSNSGASILTKWQAWAALSGIFLALGAVAVVITVMIMNGKIDDMRLVSKYDVAYKELDNYIEEYDESFKNIANEAYNNTSSYTSNNKIKPTEAQLAEAKNACLMKKGMKAEDIDYINTKKSGNELLDEGGNISSEYERISSVTSIYSEASKNIEECRENILDIVLKDITVTFGEFKAEKDDTARSTINTKIMQSVTVKNKGGRNISTLSIKIGLYDKDGKLVTTKDTVNIQGLKTGDSEEFDVYARRGSVWMTTEADSLVKKELTPKVYSINGTYEIERTLK